MLLGEYSQREIMASVMRQTNQNSAAAPTPLVSERILKGAQHALALRESQTPLIGGQNPQLNQELKSGSDLQQTPLLA